MTVTSQAVLERLRQISPPDSDGDVVSLGLVSQVVVHGGKVYFSVRVDPARAGEMEPLREACERAVAGIEGVERAVVTLTAEKESGAAPAQVAPPPRAPAARHGHGGHTGHAPRQAAGVPGIASIIAVASGKGGVGKSTVAVNLALGLQALGQRVGILDADIYGPSQPRLLGLSGRPEPAGGRRLMPMQGHGVKVMSMGFLVEEDTPMIWRGPMVIQALTQLLREVEWGDLDVLVVDMPPGTGDAQLTMAQQVPLAGAVIVSTPQDLALIDARKGINMFARVSVPILGLVENMSYFVCPSCGTRAELFGHGGARREAERLGVPFLGEVPLHYDIRERSDTGRPVVASDPDGPHAAAFLHIARGVLGSMRAGEGGARRAGPRIVMER